MMNILLMMSPRYWSHNGLCVWIADTAAHGWLKRWVPSLGYKFGRTRNTGRISSASVLLKKVTKLRRYLSWKRDNSIGGDLKFELIKINSICKSTRNLIWHSVFIQKNDITSPLSMEHTCRYFSIGDGICGDKSIHDHSVILWLKTSLIRWPARVRGLLNDELMSLLV